MLVRSLCCVTDPSLVEGASAEAREALGGAIFEDLRERGGVMTFDEAVGQALGAA